MEEYIGVFMLSERKVVVVVVVVLEVVVVVVVRTLLPRFVAGTGL